MNVRNGANRGRRSKNTVTTRSGKTLKLNSSLNDRMKARKAERAAAKASYLSTLPKNRFKRIIKRLDPKHLFHYWFSREGGIMALKVVGVCIVVGFFITIGLFAYFRKDLPEIKDISGDNLGGSITYYDRTGKIVLWQDYDAVKRIPVQSDQISTYMKDATVATEDKDFYKGGAFDVKGILRAAVHDATGGGGVVEGGSTITQQLVKLNENWTDDRTITRKVKELILATELEREYTKDDILTGYLNIAPYGGVEYGVQSAAEDYFQTSAQDLTLPEAAMLAAIPQAPEYYSPYSSTQFNSAVTDSTFNQGALIGRQQYILNQMAAQGYITQAQADAAKQVNVLALVHPQQSKYQNIKAPWFVLAAKQQLEDTYGANIVERGGWSVITTLNMSLQTKAEQLVASNLPNVERYEGNEEAMVGEDVQTGQIVSLVGGTDFDTNQNNYAAGILIPPGSSFKMYDYSAFINDNNNVGAGSVLYDSKTPLPGYTGTCTVVPSATAPACPAGTLPFLYDFDRKFPGPITIRYAIGDSRNVPAAKAMSEALPNDTSAGKVNSINKVISTADAMMDNTYDQSKNINTYNCYADTALTVTNQCGLSSAIGDGAYLYLDDHVNGLSTLGRLGSAIPRTYILKITDAADQTIYQWKQPVGKQVINQDTAYILDDIADDPGASYLSGSCTATNCSNTAGGKFQRYDGWDFAIKTGTTNDNYDGLMTSWSTKYAVVTWVGTANRNVALTSEMEYLTEPLARGWMEYAHQGLTPVNFKQPADVKTESAFVMHSHIYSSDTVPSPSTDVYPSWYVGGNASAKTSSQTIDKVSGLLATSCTPTLARETSSNSAVAVWNADIYEGGKANITGSGTGSTTATPQATDNVHSCNDAPPTITLTAPATCTTSCVITATVTQGTHPLSDPQYPQYPGTVSFSLNGQNINTQDVSDSPSTVSFTYTPTASGSGTVTATVTDSVLYQGTDTSSITYTAPTAAPTEALVLTVAPNAINTGFTWSGGIAGDTYTVYKGTGSAATPVTGCVGISANSCTGNTLVVGPTTFYVKDINTNASSGSVTTG